MTAHRCVYNSKSVEDCYVLITGGAGRVGHYAIQWAKKSGAFVIATASNSKSFEECKKAGADVVFSHPSENFVEEILDYTKGKLIDKVIDGDFGVNFNHILNIIKPNGKISTYASMTDMKPTLPFYQMMNLNIELKMVFVYDMPQKAKASAIEDITIALENDKLVNRLYKQYELSKISQAHLKIEDKQATYGAVIVKP
jgi:NADPH2:quinone reductase